MKYLIIAFKSRTNLQNFVKTLRLVGISVSIVNTPRSISVSCGLSARVDYRNLSTIMNLIGKTNVDSLIGVYVITRNGVYEQVEKVF